MRLPLHLAPALLLTTSCGLVLDFAEEGTPADGSRATSTTTSGAATTSGETSSTGSSPTSQGGAGAGGGGGQGGGGAAGGLPTEAWADTFWAVDPGAPARIKTMALDRDTTWVAGYFAGSEMRRGSKGGAEEVVFGPSDDPPEVTSFVLALDVDGEIGARIPLATSVVDEYPTDEFLGSMILPAGDGTFFLATTYRLGELLLGGVSDTESVGAGWNLVIAHVDADGEASWAMRCTATPSEEVATGADLSAVFAGMVIVDGTLRVGTTYSEGATSVECEAIVGDATPCSADDVGPSQGAVVFSIAPGDGACASAQQHIHASPHSLWLDGLRSGLDEDLFVTGHVGGDDAELEPWGADLGSGDAVAFRAPLGLDGDADDADVEAYANNWYPSVASDQEIAAGSPRNAATASDVAVFIGEETWTFGDPNERTRSEVATSVNAEGGEVLVTGYLNEDATMQTDLCGAGCEGDLAEHDPCATTANTDELPDCEELGKEVCDAPGIRERDAYWVLVADGESGPRPAIGRAFGACGDQSVVAGHLGVETISLLVEMTGHATIDVFDGELPITIPDGRIGSVIVQMPRPTVPR